MALTEREIYAILHTPNVQLNYIDSDGFADVAWEYDTPEGTHKI
jgi:hypothetical protein